MDLDSVVQRLIEIGPIGVMCEDEIARGFSPVALDSRPWFLSKHWHESVIIENGKEIRIIAIQVKYPKEGAFKKMIEGIKADGLAPVVVCPFSDMLAIMKKWGWVKTVINGSFLDREEQWREKSAIHI